MTNGEWSPGKVDILVQWLCFVKFELKCSKLKRKAWILHKFGNIYLCMLSWLKDFSAQSGRWDLHFSSAFFLYPCVPHSFPILWLFKRYFWFFTCSILFAFVVIVHYRKKGKEETHWRSGLLWSSQPCKCGKNVKETTAVTHRWGGEMHVDTNEKTKMEK